jgi:hypothetical protein
MWSWVLILLLPLAILLVIEEVSQFIWRSYLKDSEGTKKNKFVLLKEQTKKIIHKYRKDPSL